MAKKTEKVAVRVISSACGWKKAETERNFQWKCGISATERGCPQPQQCARADTLLDCSDATSNPPFLRLGTAAVRCCVGERRQPIQKCIRQDDRIYRINILVLLVRTFPISNPVHPVHPVEIQWSFADFLSSQ